MYTPSSQRGGVEKTAPGTSHCASRRSGSERATYPLIPWTPQRHPKKKSTTQSGKRKSRHNLRRFIAATQITHQTMGRENPTAELIVHPPCLIHSHDNLHPIRTLKIRIKTSTTHYRTKRPPPSCVRTQNQWNIKSWKKQRSTTSKLYCVKLQMPTR